MSATIAKERVDSWREQWGGDQGPSPQEIDSAVFELRQDCGVYVDSEEHAVIDDGLAWMRSTPWFEALPSWKKQSLDFVWSESGGYRLEKAPPTTPVSVARDAALLPFTAVKKIFQSSAALFKEGSHLFGLLAYPLAAGVGVFGLATAAVTWTLSPVLSPTLAAIGYFHRKFTD